MVIAVVDSFTKACVINHIDNWIRLGWLKSIFIDEVRASEQQAERSKASSKRAASEEGHSNAPFTTNRQPVQPQELALQFKLREVAITKFGNWARGEYGRKIFWTLMSGSLVSTVKR